MNTNYAIRNKQQVNKIGIPEVLFGGINLSTPVQKAKRTRAKNIKKAEKQQKQLRAARSSARNARSELKSYKEGFKDGIAALK